MLAALIKDFVEGRPPFQQQANQKVLHRAVLVRVKEDRPKRFLSNALRMQFVNARAARHAFGAIQSHSQLSIKKPQARLVYALGVLSEAAAERAYRCLTQRGRRFNTTDWSAVPQQKQKPYSHEQGFPSGQRLRQCFAINIVPQTWKTFFRNLPRRTGLNDEGHVAFSGPSMSQGFFGRTA